MNWKNLLSTILLGSGNIKLSEWSGDRSNGFLRNAFQGLLGRYTGSNLTPAENEANAFNAAEAEKTRMFNAEEAEKARNFEMEMANTQKQRQVADFAAAGINPMFAAGQAVSLPSASNASASAAASVSPSAAAFNLPGLISSLSQLRVNRAQAKNLEADASLKEAQTAETETKIDKLIVDIESGNLDNEAKQITNSYLGRLKSAEVRVTENEADYYDATVKQINKSIEKMDYEELEIFIRACDTAEHIQYLISQENLNQDQQNELKANIRKLNAETRLINLNVDNFDEITVIGSRSTTVKTGPMSVSESDPVTLKDLKERAKHHLTRFPKDKNLSGRNIINGYESWD